MKNHILPLCLCLVLFLNGCVPNAVTYYRPSAESGNVLTSLCVPTESIIEFDLPHADSRLRVRAFAGNGKNINQISLFFSGKEWSRINFKTTSFQIHDIEKGTVMAASSVLAYKAEGISNLTTEPYLAPPERPGLPRLHIQINSSNQLPGNFELISPAIVIDGKEIAFPLIRFEQKLWIGISPFNC